MKLDPKILAEVRAANLPRLLATVAKVQAAIAATNPSRSAS